MTVPFETLSDDALVFIFQADQTLPKGIIPEIEQQLQAFTVEWTSHQQAVKGCAKIYYDRFIILFADESVQDLSGCSKDKVTRLITEIGEKYHINFFNRLQVTLLDESTAEVIAVPLQNLSEYYAAGKITADMLLFNNLVSTKKDWGENWKQPFSGSRFSNYIIQKAN